MKQNKNVSDFAEKIASVDGPETEIIIKSGIPCIKDDMQRFFTKLMKK